MAQSRCWSIETVGHRVADLTEADLEVGGVVGVVGEVVRKGMPVRVRRLRRLLRREIDYAHTFAENQSAGQMVEQPFPAVQTRHGHSGMSSPGPDGNVSAAGTQASSTWPAG